MRAVRVPAECIHSPWMQDGAVRTLSIFSAQIIPITSAKAACGSATGYENFSKDARRFVKADYAAIRQYGKLLRQMTPAQVEHSLFQLLFYRYWNYDLSKPFQEQFEHNQRQLLAFLQEQLAQNGGSI